MSGWTVQNLEPRPRVAAPPMPPFVAKVSSRRSFAAKVGTGFLVHPRILVTAAHVVSFPSAGKVLCAQKVNVRAGAWDCWADAFALPGEWLAGMPQLFDFAVLRLAEPACEPALTCLLEEMAGAAVAAAELLGFGAAPEHIQAQRKAEELEYPLADKPSWSGGAISKGKKDNRPLVIGVHTSHTNDDGMGRGLVLAAEEILRAMRLLGLGGTA